MSAAEQLSFLPPAPPDDKNARFTLRPTMDWILKKARVRGFDLDVAAEKASHWAERYYTVLDDGLFLPWDAPNIFCNPPYDDIEPWVVKAWDEIIKRNCRLIVMLLPENRREQPWWHEWVEPYRHAERFKGNCFLKDYSLPGRQQFGTREDPLGLRPSDNTVGSLILVFRTL